MSLKPLEILKKGFTQLSNKIKDRKNELNAKLARKEAISSSEEEWLDNEGNTVDEQRVLDILELAPDYEKGVEQLDYKGKAIVQKLRELAGDVAKVTGNKRKRMVLLACSLRCGTDNVGIGSEFEKETKHLKPKPASAKPVPAKPMNLKKENATLAQRIEVLNWFHENGKNQSKTARHFDTIYPNLHIRQPLVSSWVNNEPIWRERWEQSNHQSDHMAKRVRQTEHPEISEMMFLWVSKAMGDGILLTGEVIRQKWNTFADLAGIPKDDRLNLSNGWLDRFKERNGLRQQKRHGEAASASQQTVEQERKRIQKLIKEAGYELCDIYNMDETGLFYGCVPVSNFLAVDCREGLTLGPT
jgi:hypothetical protein